MIRITKLTDYGIVLMTRFALDPEWRAHTVPDLAKEAHLPIPTVSKILKLLARSRLLVSHRGIKGGYRLAREPEEITILQIISALDGPIAITDCSAEPAGKCELERLCPVRTNWQRINVAIRDTLETITLADMARPLPNSFVPLSRLQPNTEKTEALELCQP